MELDHQEEPTGDVETLKSTEEDEQILSTLTIINPSQLNSHALNLKD